MKHIANISWSMVYMRSIYMFVLGLLRCYCLLILLACLHGWLAGIRPICVWYSSCRVAVSTSALLCYAALISCWVYVPACAWHSLPYYYTIILHIYIISFYGVLLSSTSTHQTCPPLTKHQRTVASILLITLTQQTIIINYLHLYFYIPTFKIYSKY